MDKKRRAPPTTSTPILQAASILPTPSLVPKFCIYCDTSGSESDPGHGTLTLAACIARQERWWAISPEWRYVLAEFGVTAFSASACSKGEGEFRHLTRSTRTRLVDALVEILVRHRVTVCSSTTRFKDYAAVNADYRLAETFGGPYSVNAKGMMFILSSVFDEHRKLGELRIAAVETFFEHGDKGQRSFEAFVDQLGPKQRWLNISFHPKVLRDASGRIYGYFRGFEAADLAAFAFRRSFIDERRRLAKSVEPLLGPAPGFQHRLAGLEGLLRMCERDKVPRRSKQA
jgi:hypothetical protein